jgi:hypothetical protein
LSEVLIAQTLLSRDSQLKVGQVIETAKLKRLEKYRMICAAIKLLGIGYKN